MTKCAYPLKILMYKLYSICKLHFVKKMISESHSQLAEY